MKIIQYKTLGAMLEPGPGGKSVRKSVNVTAEVAFSEEALRQAEAAALPGTVRIIEKEAVASFRNAAPSICLTDRATGKLFEVYIENGQLMMEVI